MSTVPYSLDRWLLLTVGALICVGLIMVASASIYNAGNLDQPLYYFKQQFIFTGMGLFLAWLLFKVPLSIWQQSAPVLFFMSILLLALVLIPGIGKEVNASRRWLSLGIINIQVVEIVKFFAVIYIASYLHRHQDILRQSYLQGFKIFAPFIVVTALLLLQPDMGSAVIIFLTVLAMMFLGGIRLDTLIGLIAVGVVLFLLLALLEPYRLARLQGFMDPWADPFGSGFQLTQALIAFGQGDWLGVGLGNSMQKLSYLPEAHTDFLYSILAEELGLVGAIIVLLVFLVFIWRAFNIGRASEMAGKQFGAYVAYGVAVWLGLQAFVNLGVNMGVLPTKGLTLPFMSYGGSSLVMDCMAIALLFRVDFETGLARKTKVRIRR